MLTRAVAQLVEHTAHNRKVAGSNPVRAIKLKLRFMEVKRMSVFEAIGYIWVIFTSALATIMFFYCAWIGAQVLLVPRMYDPTLANRKTLRVGWGRAEDKREVEIEG